jgi:hypothetical protein
MLEHSMLLHIQRAKNTVYAYGIGCGAAGRSSEYWPSCALWHSCANWARLELGTAARTGRGSEYCSEHCVRERVCVCIYSILLNAYGIGCGAAARTGRGRALAVAYPADAHEARCARGRARRQSVALASATLGTSAHAPHAGTQFTCFTGTKNACVTCTRALLGSSSSADARQARTRLACWPVQKY